MTDWCRFTCFYCCILRTKLNRARLTELWEWNIFEITERNSNDMETNKKIRIFKCSLYVSVSLCLSYLHTNDDGGLQLMWLQRIVVECSIVCIYFALSKKPDCWLFVCLPIENCSKLSDTHQRFICSISKWMPSKSKTHKKTVSTFFRYIYIDAPFCISWIHWDDIHIDGPITFGDFSRNAEIYWYENGRFCLSVWNNNTEHWKWFQNNNNNKNSLIFLIRSKTLTHSIKIHLWIFIN